MRRSEGRFHRLDHADENGMVICMRTTLNIDEGLLKKAREMTGETEKTRLIHLGLEALIERTAARRLADLGGSDPRAEAGARRRTVRARP
jgi:Arc/MetJ family transcription regulator